MQTNEEYLQSVVRKAIKAYSVYIEILKTKKKKNKNEEAKIVGTVFGLRKAINLKLDELIKKEIDEKQDIYIQQQDMFECGIVEGLQIYRRIMQHDEQYHNNIKLLINYTTNYDFNFLDK